MSPTDAIQSLSAMVMLIDGGGVVTMQSHLFRLFGGFGNLENEQQFCMFGLGGLSDLLVVLFL